MKTAKKILKCFCLEILGGIRLGIFIHRCPLCGRDLVYGDETCLCRVCRARVLSFRTPVCSICGRVMGVPPLRDRCGECMLKPPPFRKHASYGPYIDELREVILFYKYGGHRPLKKFLGQLYIETFEQKIAPSESGPFDCIAAVPPDPGRRRDFNPLRETAAVLAGRLGVPLYLKALVKIKQTVPQAGLTRAQRLKNLDGAFRLGVPPFKLEGKKILLLDDVYTTGTTLIKCSGLLVKAGADVVVLTLAHSV